MSSSLFMNKEVSLKAPKIRGYLGYPQYKNRASSQKM